MRFWDSSAAVPLIVREPRTEEMTAILSEDREVLVWWGSEVECASALARRERADALTAAQADQAMRRLSALSQAWHEVEPLIPVRRMARRLLRVHPLAAADALQLAAALVACEGDPTSLTLVTLDAHLARAARREGLDTVPERSDAQP